MIRPSIEYIGTFSTVSIVTPLHPQVSLNCLSSGTETPQRICIERLLCHPLLSPTSRIPEDLTALSPDQHSINRFGSSQLALLKYPLRLEHPLRQCPTTSSSSVQPVRKPLTPRSHRPLKRVTIVPGFTGKYITEYLDSHPERSRPTPFTFAIAGRSQKKLEDLKRELKLDDEIGILIINIGDYGSVEAAVTQTKVVINTVGPYWKYGDHVVRFVDFSMTFRMGPDIPIELAQVMESTTSIWRESLISSKPQ